MEQQTLTEWVRREDVRQFDSVVTHCLSESNCSEDDRPGCCRQSRYLLYTVSVLSKLYVLFLINQCLPATTMSSPCVCACLFLIHNRFTHSFLRWSRAIDSQSSSLSLVLGERLTVWLSLIFLCRKECYSIARVLGYSFAMKTFVVVKLSPSFFTIGEYNAADKHLLHLRTHLTHHSHHLGAR